MRRFAALYDRLDASTATRAKLDALVAYFREAPPEDACWALHVLAGGTLKRTFGGAALRALGARASGLPPWLLESCWAHVGDLAETLALLVPGDGSGDDEPLHRWVERLRELPRLEPAARESRVLDAWSRLGERGRFLLNKLLTGALRVGASRRLVVQALAEVADVPVAVVAHRITGDAPPSADAYRRLLAPAGDDDTPSLERPYPFFLASPLEVPPERLGARRDWLVEWKWDGIRAQLLRRGDGLALWSRGEERLDGRFPEIERAARALPPDTVLDGEVLGWRDGRPLPFLHLQRRIGRRRPGTRTLADCPVVFMAYDLLERDGADWRDRPLADRRAALAELLDGDALRLSPALDAAADWVALAAQRADARARGVEGLMLKRLASPYQLGRRRGDWWKWKLDPLTVDAVLVYAQPGHGRRATLFTDYSFAVWDGDRLVVVAKAYSGLADDEVLQLDRWIRANTTDRFGPVRAVRPELVFELAFEGVNRSRRHASGVAVRFPRILRRRDDKPAREADSLAQLQALADG